MLGGNGKVVKASMLSSLSSRARERASKEFLKIMGVVGVGLHLLRVAFTELKKGADLAVSKKVSSVMTWVVWCVVCLVQKAGQGVEALASGGVFVMVKFKSWMGRSMLHDVASKSRSWALVFHLDVVG